MSYVPDDWTPTASILFYKDARSAIEWLRKAFGFEVRVLVDAPDGGVAHSELVFHEALIQVAGAGGMAGSASPKDVAGSYTQALYLFVPDIDAHYEQAKRAGAEILRELETQGYGDRVYACLDCDGHPWYFGQRLDDAANEAATAEHRP